MPTCLQVRPGPEAYQGTQGFRQVGHHRPVFHARRPRLYPREPSAPAPVQDECVPLPATTSGVTSPEQVKARRCCPTTVAQPRFAFVTRPPPRSRRRQRSTSTPGHSRFARVLDDEDPGGEVSEPRLLSLRPDDEDFDSDFFLFLLALWDVGAETVGMSRSWWSGLRWSAGEGFGGVGTGRQISMAGVVERFGGEHRDTGLEHDRAS
ncbi:hypothetical protein MTO96_002214 [Rhipicephalus appendiculatus]